MSDVANADDFAREGFAKVAPRNALTIFAPIEIDWSMEMQTYLTLSEL